jgi:hypothetical protein
MVDMGEAALFASHDGLIAVSQSGAKNITESVLSRQYWRNLIPSTIHGYRYHQYYVGFYNDSAGFIFDLTNGNYFELDFYAKAGYFNTKTGLLYLCVGNDFVIFDNGNSLNYEWLSKEFELTGEVLSCVKVRGKNLENSTLDYYADGNLLTSQTLNGNINVFRLPAHRSDLLQFKLSGTGEVKNISFATSMTELK